MSDVTNYVGDCEHASMYRELFSITENIVSYDRFHTKGWMNVTDDENPTDGSYSVVVLLLTFQFLKVFVFSPARFVWDPRRFTFCSPPRLSQTGQR